MNAVSLAVNESALFQNLKFAFSAASVLGELLQNARRAQATKIAITFDGGTLIVTDDGHGVSNLQDLLTAAGSGWNAELAEAENPFGLGFLATLYSSSAIEVSSRCAGDDEGKGFSAESVALIEGAHASIKVVQMEPGTCIKLQGFTLPRFHPTSSEDRVSDLGKRLQKLVEGFALPVTYNGADLDRPYAEDDKSFVLTEVGRVVLKLGHVNSRTRLFLQGLPVGSDCGHEPCTIIHLNSSFVAKLPDRTSLVDETGGWHRIRKAMKDLARDQLAEIKSSVSPETFVLTWAHICLSWDCTELLNDIDVVPGNWFVDWKVSHPGHYQSWESLEGLPGVITREQLTSSRVFRLPDIDFMEARCWLAASGAYAFERDFPLHLDHWMNKLILDCDNDSDGEELVDMPAYEITFAKELGSANLRCWNVCRLTVVEGLAIKRNATGETFGVKAGFDMGKSTLFITEEASPSSHIRLTCDYVNGESECWDEGAEEEDESLLEKTKAEILATDPVHLLTIMLKSHAGLGVNAKLANTSFTVVFDEEGRFKEVKL